MDNTVVQKAVWRLKDNILQWFWFVSRIDRGHIGYDRGPLTWLRIAKQKQLRRRLHLCLLDIHPREGKFGRFTAFWINERSRSCSASVNERVEDADIVWVYSQDPVPPEIKRELLQIIGRARPGIPVINHPDVYNSYHDEDTFRILERAGVSVPRSTFTEQDIGKTLVVYKVRGKHGSSKFLSPYRGPIDGFRPFEFVDSRGPEGLYRKYRALYVAGIIHPSYVAFSRRWNVERRTVERVRHAFEMEQIEIESLRVIAETLDIQYFSVDYLRRGSDGQPVFADINVYPQPIAFTETARQFGYYGRWHIADNRVRLGMPEPSGKPFWDMFDTTMLSLTHKEPFTGRDLKQRQQKSGRSRIPGDKG